MFLIKYMQYVYSCLQIQLFWSSNDTLIGSNVTNVSTKLFTQPNLISVKNKASNGSHSVEKNTVYAWHFKTII